MTFWILGIIRRKNTCLRGSLPPPRQRNPNQFRVIDNNNSSGWLENLLPSFVHLFYGRHSAQGWCVCSHSILMTILHFTDGQTRVKQVKQLAEPGTEPESDSGPTAPVASALSSQRFCPSSSGLLCAGSGTGRRGPGGPEKVEASQVELSGTFLKSGLMLVSKAGISVGVVLSSPCLESGPALPSEWTSDEKGAHAIT